MHLISIFGGFVISAFFMSFIVMGINLEGFVSFIYRYQTLLAGGLALIGAFATIKKISKQIKSNERQHTESLKHQGNLVSNTRERKLKSVRAILPWALSESNSFIDECYQYMGAYLECFETNQGKDIGEQPIIRDEITELFRQVIEFSNVEVGKRVHQVLIDYQILYARMIDLRVSAISTNGLPFSPLDTNSHESGLESYLIRLADLSIKLDSLYVYGRELKSETPDPLDIEPFDQAIRDSLKYPNLRSVYETLNDKWNNIQNWPRKSFYS